MRRRPEESGDSLPAPDRWAHIVVDGNTRTFWSRGALAPSTLVESDAAPRRTPASRRVASLVAAHDRGEPAPGRPRANPAFSEALFIELMRAEQYERAYALLAPECQLRWRDAERFAAAHHGVLTRLLGVEVTAVRYLDEWIDPDTGTAHIDVAELDVNYALATGRDGTTSMAKTVHLLPNAGRWRSLSYP